MIDALSAFGGMVAIFCIMAACFVVLTSVCVATVTVYRWAKRGYEEELNDVAEIGRMKERIQA